MQTKQIHFTVKNTKKGNSTHKGRLKNFEAGVQVRDSHTEARLIKNGFWNPYLSTGVMLRTYRKGEEPQ